MKKDDFIQAGMSEAVASFVFSEKRNNKALNQEGMEIGDTFKIEGISDSVSENVNQETGDIMQWIDVLTSGDRQTISISRLVGTSKIKKYFNASRGEDVELAEFDPSKVLTLPRREGDALVYISQNCIGKTYQVVGKAENCGQFDQTFYLFAEVQA